MIKIVVLVCSVLNILAGVLLFPAAWLVVMSGLGGPEPLGSALAGIGYVLVFVSSVVCLFKYRFYPLFIGGYALLALANYQSTGYWDKHNSDLCAQLRADPYCKEDTLGFSCSQESSLGGFSTSSRICE